MQRFTQVHRYTTPEAPNGSAAGSRRLISGLARLAVPTGLTELCRSPLQ